jgi:hypothetical protein
MPILRYLKIFNLVNIAIKKVFFILSPVDSALFALLVVSTSLLLPAFCPELFNRARYTAALAKLFHLFITLLCSMSIPFITNLLLVAYNGLASSEIAG